MLKNTLNVFCLLFVLLGVVLISINRDGKIPINKVGFFSYLIVCWMTSLVWKIFRNSNKPLSEEDVWECSEWETVEVNAERSGILFSF